MLTFNTSKGIAIAEIQIKRKKKDKDTSKGATTSKTKRESTKKSKEKRYLYISETDENPITNFKLEKDEILFPVYHDQERYGNYYPNRIYCAAMSLSGKSYICAKLAESCVKQHPEKRLVVISWSDNDPSHKDIAKRACYHKITVSDELLDDPIELNELHDSIVIFDDIGNFPKEIAHELALLRDKCFNAGRHANISCISIQQKLLDGKNTATCLTNAFQVIIFPHTATRFQAGEWLKRYLYLNKKQIQTILNLPSEWVILNTTSPLYVLHEKGAFFLTELQKL